MSNKRQTVFDYVAVALLNAIVAFPTGILFWLGLNGVPFTYAGFLPFESVFWFTGIVVLIGIFTKDAWLIDLFGRIWQLLYRWFTHL